MNWIMTYTKKKFYPLAPKREDIDIEDIAHSLSMLCRFNGHCPKFYSVAEHSILVSSLLPDEYKLWGLLHDAGEAYLSDIPRPIKNSLKGFENYEDKILKEVIEKHALIFPMPKEVKKADDDMLEIELNHFFYNKPSEIIKSLTPEMTKKIFLKQYERLTSQ